MDSLHENKILSQDQTNIINECRIDFDNIKKNLPTTDTVDSFNILKSYCVTLSSFLGDLNDINSIIMKEMTMITKLQDDYSKELLIVFKSKLIDVINCDNKNYGAFEKLDSLHNKVITMIVDPINKIDDYSCNNVFTTFKKTYIFVTNICAIYDELLSISIKQCIDMHEKKQQKPQVPASNNDEDDNSDISEWETIYSDDSEYFNDAHNVDDINDIDNIESIINFESNVGA